ETSETFNYCGLTYARFANQHRRIRAFAVAEYFDDLLNFFFAANRWCNLISARHPVKRHAKVFQIRRQFEFLSILFFLQFSLVDISAHVFDDCVGRSTQAAPHIAEEAVVLLATSQPGGSFESV